jgi:hypothetical protein
MTRIAIVAIASAALAASANAQQHVSTVTGDHSVVAHSVVAHADGQQLTTSFDVRTGTGQAAKILLDGIRTDFAPIPVESKPVMNAPYSAEATSESVQTLADGNRIVHRAVTRVYRDSAGRTRRETLNADGQVQMVTISDPTSATSVALDGSNNRVSHSNWTTTSPAPGAVSVYTISKSGEGQPAVVTSKETIVAHTMSNERIVADGEAGTVRVTVGHQLASNSQSTKEDLGQQAIDGVMAKGTRTTTVIAPGSIGNDREIRIVSEEWFSPELQLLVLTKHSDPRTGETTYSLKVSSRSEPDRSLFEAAAGATTK